MRKMSRTISAVLFVMIVVSPWSCNAQITNCTTSKMPNGILYRIQEFSASQCYYSWTDMTGHVLATQKEKNDELVYSSSKTDILILKCCESIKYRRICSSEGFEVMAVCNTTCQEDLKSNVATDQTVIIVIVILSILVLFISSLLFIFRDKVRRCIRGGYSESNQNPNGHEHEEENL